MGFSTGSLYIKGNKMNMYEYKVLSTKDILDAQILKTEAKYGMSFKSPKKTRMLINNYLNTLGDDGWELVSVRARTFLGNWNGDEYFLKKPKN
jgi:hypothetical protein